MSVDTCRKIKAVLLNAMLAMAEANKFQRAVRIRNNTDLTLEFRIPSSSDKGNDAETIVRHGELNAKMVDLHVKREESFRNKDVDGMLANQTLQEFDLSSQVLWPSHFHYADLVSTMLGKHGHLLPLVGKSCGKRLGILDTHSDPRHVSSSIGCTPSGTLIRLHPAHIGISFASRLPPIRSTSQRDGSEKADMIVGASTDDEGDNALLRNVLSAENRQTQLTLGLLATYYAVAIAYYMPVEGWDVLECIYFATVIVTTVGFGDFTPSTDGSKVFTIVYLHFALIIVALVVDNLQKTLLQRVVSTAVESEESLGLFDREGTRVLRWKGFVSAFTIYILCVVAGTVVFRYSEVGVESEVDGWIDGLYLTVVMLTTVGFGDLAPVAEKSKVFSCVLMLIGVPAFAYSLQRLAKAIFGEPTDTDKSIQTVRGLTYEKLADMQSFCDELTAIGARNNADGTKLSRFEFVCFTLVRNGVTDTKTINKIISNFHELDSAGDGYLDIQDFAPSLGRRVSCRLGTLFVCAVTVVYSVIRVSPL